MNLGNNSLGKDELRIQCRRYRETLDDSRYEELSSAIVGRVLQSSVFDEAEVIHIYWPITERREVDTRPLIAALHEAGKQLVVPVCDPTADPSAGRMLYRVFAGSDKMQKNVWGTYEPLASPAVPPPRIDLVIAPALAVDRHGYRLGYGGGFYDRFLKDADCATLSLVYSQCLFDLVPHDLFDVPVGLIVTEDEMVRVGTSAT
jgi:5-formyltetrahydrofolate cyclo-ligase